MAFLINVLVTATLIVMMLRIGFDVDFAEVAATAKNKSLVAKTLGANYILVPAITIALLLVLHVAPLVSVAFLILSVCPGAPFGPPLTAIAK